MTGAHDGGLFQRFDDNPILTAHDVPYACNTQPARRLWTTPSTVVDILAPNVDEHGLSVE